MVWQQRHDFYRVWGVLAECQEVLHTGASECLEDRFLRGAEKEGAGDAGGVTQEICGGRGGGGC